MLSDLYPTPSLEDLKSHFLGKNLAAINATPAAVLDRAVIRRNCDAMLQTVKQLGLGFRAHVKSHKTTEITKLQVGEESPDIKLVVSTVAEAEHLLPYLRQCQDKGKTVNVLYGVPAAPSIIPRLAAVAKVLGDDTTSFMVDHPDQLNALRTFPVRTSVFIKVDTGYKRAGIDASSRKTARELMTHIQDIANTGLVKLAGFYSHLGSSYDVNSSSEAVDALVHEIETIEDVALQLIAYMDESSKGKWSDEITLSVGATPTVTAAQNLLGDAPKASRATQAIERAKKRFKLELHGGNYPLLDMQQMATHARPSTSDIRLNASLSAQDIAFRVLVEVASVYNEREKPEALIAAGSLALGRDVCKSYPGWGVVSPWSGMDGESSATEGAVYNEEQRHGWIVNRISQEHGILRYEGPVNQMREQSLFEDRQKLWVRKLKVGEKLLIWPNHACIAGAGFGWYLIVDSDMSMDRRDEIVDVWIRWRGW